MDERGWYWWEKARIRAAWLLFVAMEALAKGVWLASGKRLALFHGANHTWSRLGWLWIAVASEAYLIDDLKRDDMPEHERIGGVWR